MFLKYLEDRYKISDERMAICKSCEHLDQEKVKCNLCGCFMEYKTKMKSQSCPIGKWTAVDTE